MIHPGAAFAFDAAAHVVNEILDIGDIEFEFFFWFVISYRQFLGHDFFLP
jgi:hypothetical protein